MRSPMEEITPCEECEYETECDALNDPERCLMEMEERVEVA